MVIDEYYYDEFSIENIFMNNFKSKLYDDSFLTENGQGNQMIFFTLFQINFFFKDIFFLLIVSSLDLL